MKKESSKIIFAIVGVTYRCNAKCQMCHVWRYPSVKEEEIGVDIISKLPPVPVFNITGGEPFLRDDLEEIVAVLKKKSKRVVISTNGYFTDRVVRLVKKFPDIGIRISLEGLPKTNDRLRGLEDGFDRGLRTLIEIKALGVKDIGFGMTISDENINDLLPLYRFSKFMKVEFATAVVHNSYYFCKYDNEIQNKGEMIREFERLIGELLQSRNVKDWYRAYFNYGLINYISGGRRMVPCGMGISSFYLDPHGEIRPCNVMEESMGNINKGSFEEIWNGKEAQRIKSLTKCCDKNCWMVGSVSEIMKGNIFVPTKWILRAKLLGRRAGLKK